MNKYAKWLIPAAVLVIAPSAIAQGPGGGGPGGFTMPPEMAARMKKMKAFNDNHPHLATLSRTLRSLPTLEDDPKTAFTKDQSKKLLVIFKQWHGKTVLTEDEAGQANKQFN